MTNNYLDWDFYIFQDISQIFHNEQTKKILTKLLFQILGSKIPFFARKLIKNWWLRFLIKLKMFRFYFEMFQVLFRTDHRYSYLICWVILSGWKRIDSSLERSLASNQNQVRNPSYSLESSESVRSYLGYKPSEVMLI